MDRSMRRILILFVRQASVVLVVGAPSLARGPIISQCGEYCFVARHDSPIPRLHLRANELDVSTIAAHPRAAWALELP